MWLLFKICANASFNGQTCKEMCRNAVQNYRISDIFYDPKIKMLMLRILRQH